jgi:hypothetical protein
MTELACSNSSQFDAGAIVMGARRDLVCLQRQSLSGRREKKGASAYPAALPCTIHPMLPSNKSPRIATAFGGPCVQASAKQNDLPHMVAVVDDRLPKHSVHRVGLLSVGWRRYLNWPVQNLRARFCEAHHFPQML